MSKPRLGELLLQMGALDALQLQSALGQQRQWGTPLGQVLLERGFCSLEHVLAALSKQTGFPIVDLDREPADPAMAQVIPQQIAEEHGVVPLRLEGKRREQLVIAVTAPGKLDTLDAIRSVAGKQRVIPMLAGDAAIKRAIRTLYGVPEPAASRAGPDPAVVDEVEFDLGGEPPAERPVLVFGWPEAAGRGIVQALESRQLPARIVGSDEVLASEVHDVVVAPLPAIEGILSGGVLRSHLVVAVKVPESDLYRAQRVGARGYLGTPVDAEMLVRVVSRARSKARTAGG